MRFAQAQSVQHRRTLLAEPLAVDTAARYAEMAEESLARQREMEARDTMPFEDFRERYVAPASLRV
jgi:glutamate--cysteine ligase